MKFLIAYECFYDGKTSIINQFEFESEKEPGKYDEVMREVASKDSIQFYKSGSGSININLSSG